MTTNHRVIHPVEHDGRRYEPGSVIALDDPAAAAPLVELGAVEPADEGARAPEGAPAPAGREDLIRAAITRLEPSGADWTQDGRPQVAALVAAGAPRDLTAAERDEVWGAIPAGLIGSGFDSDADAA